jgi:hypothetical protein
MNTIRKVYIPCLAGLLFLLTLGATRASADTITDSNVEFTGTVTSTTVTLTIQCLDAGTCGTWYLGDVTLKGFTFTGAPTLGTAPAGYTVLNGGQNNNSLANGGGCNSTQAGQAVCWDAGFPPLTFQLGSGVNTFTANFPNSDGLYVGPLHVQATAYLTSAGTQTQGNKVLAVSDDLTAVPEPASIALFGSGLVALAGMIRRRRNRKQISAS